MGTYLISFATPEFYRGQKKLNRSAMKFGIDHCIAYRRNDIIGTDFYRRNKTILDKSRGAGYWLWKPYIIHNALHKVSDGDVVIYSDSGASVIADLSPLINICVSREGLVFFQVHNQDGKDGGIHINRRWTKRDCFVLMQADREEFYNSGQIAGSPQFYIKNKKNIHFVEEWLSFCVDPRILTDAPNNCGLDNLPEFIDHRHDQSILSILVKKYGLEVFRDPSQFGDHTKMEAYRREGELQDGLEYAEELCLNSPYGTLFDLHRKRNFSVSVKLHKLKKKIRNALF